MDFKIVKPVEGVVTLEMTWDEAEVLTRLIGMANSGNLEKIAPGLAEFTASMMETVGRNMNTEARRFYAHTWGGQTYITKYDSEPGSDERL